MGETLRLAHKLRKEQSGILVKKIHPLAPAAQLVRKGDVIMAVDSDKIASDGSVVFRKGERISFHFKISQKFVGDKVRVPAGCSGPRVPTRARLPAGRQQCTKVSRANPIQRGPLGLSRLRCAAQVLLDVMRDGKTMKLELALTTCALLQVACHRQPAADSRE